METFPACLQQPVTWNSLDDRWGATYPSWFILPPPPHTHTPMIFKQWLAIDFVMAVNGLTCINGQFSQKKDTAR